MFSERKVQTATSRKHDSANLRRMLTWIGNKKNKRLRVLSRGLESTKLNDRIVIITILVKKTKR